jgi:hypothetical protein
MLSLLEATDPPSYQSAPQPGRSPMLVADYPPYLVGLEPTPRRLRVVPAREATIGYKRERASEIPVGVGHLVALPILRAPDGAPVDLLETAAERPALLLLASTDKETSEHLLEAAAAALPVVEDAGAVLFIVFAEATEPAAELNSVSSAVVTIDHGGRFAYTLGFASSKIPTLGTKSRRSAFYVLDQLGIVRWADLNGPVDLANTLEALEKVSAGRSNKPASTVTQ